jgi:hypothetical protein
VPNAPDSSPVATAQDKVQIITACNGRSGNANFRSAPSLLSEAVLGVVAQGQLVQLTGKTVVSDGMVWYEAIALTPLFASVNTLAANTKVGQRGQRGWISGCFVNGEVR